jgi:hypothetical protein
MPEQRNYGNSGSANGMEMGNSSQVSTRSDFLIKQLVVMNYCLKHKQPTAPTSTFTSGHFSQPWCNSYGFHMSCFTIAASQFCEQLFLLKRYIILWV